MTDADDERCGCDEGERRTVDCPEHFYLSNKATTKYVEHDEHGTSYRLLFAPFPSERATKREGAPLAVAIFSPVRSVYAFQPKGYVHWSYVMEKFKVSPVDAEVIAKMIMNYYRDET